MKAGQTKAITKTKIAKALGVSKLETLNNMLQRVGVSLPKGKCILTEKEGREVCEKLGLDLETIKNQ